MHGISAWHLWIIAGLIAGALEVKLTNFVMLWFAVGAFVAALGAGLGGSHEVQIGLFIAVSVALFAASRTLFHHAFMRGADTHLIGSEAMVGTEATVTEALPAAMGEGTVRINGELWAAQSVDGAVAAGERVLVQSVEGLRLRVRRLVPGPIEVQHSGGSR